MTPAQTEAFVDAAAAALDLTLPPDYRAGVLRYFALAAEMARRLDATPLDTQAESAVSFAPVAPGSSDQ